MLGLISKHLGEPQVMLGNLKEISQVYHDLEDSRSFFCSSRPVELCTQILLHLHADVAEVIVRAVDLLNQSCSASDG